MKIEIYCRKVLFLSGDHFKLFGVGQGIKSIRENRMGM